MTDLIARAKDYLAKTEGITGGNWTLSYAPYTGNIFFEVEHAGREPQGTDPQPHDTIAMSLTPTARKLIEDFIQMMTEGE